MTSEGHARAKALFLEAIEHPPAARRAFVEAATADDAALRREIESLLAFHDDAPQVTALLPTPTPHLLLPAGLSSRSRTRSLPTQLLTRSAKRLEVASLVIAACVVVMWGLVNAVQGELAGEFLLARQWMPPVAVLVASSAMFAACRWPLNPQALIRVGLVYEVIVSVALAITQYADAFRLPAEFLNSDRVGLSYVATWTLFFTVLVPARPAEALIALIASNAAVPLMYLQQMLSHRAPRLDVMTFASIFIWPYVLGVISAYIAARIVHQLGMELRHAQELGGYRLEHLLGRGGMGEVWRASHHTLARPAAIKVIRPGVVGGDPLRAAAAVARFETEAQIIASLESPHTIRLYDFGTTDDGNVFYVMELLDGVDLEALVRRQGPMPPGRVVHILRQVCASLAEAHQRGLVHRDIKPANIYLCRQGLELDVVKVLDFGLATMRSDRALTTGGDAVVGTPDYMAPESTERGGVVDGRSDLYAVGCLAYWLLTGRVVFPRENVADVLQAHRRDAPQPPRLVSPAIVPAELERVILACLEKSPGDRPASALVLAEELASLAQTTPWSQSQAAAAGENDKSAGQAGHADGERSATKPR